MAARLTPASPLFFLLHRRSLQALQVKRARPTPHAPICGSMAWHSGAKGLSCWLREGWTRRTWVPAARRANTLDTERNNAMPEAPLIACPKCHLLQAETPLPPRGESPPLRRRALSQHTSDSLDCALAFALAAVVMLVIANSLPIAGLEVTGQHTETTLRGAAQALYDQDRVAVAGLVFATTLFAPAVGNWP